ncbi:MAG: leucine-rich repeat protein [[Clostridium] leptum]
MMLTFLPAGAVSAFAEGNLGPYDCGETPGTVTATLSPNSDGEEGEETYTLTITGNGPMANYDRYITSSNDSYAPWYEKIQNITQLIVEGGVTTLGDNILYYSYSDSNSKFHSFHPNLRKVKLPEGLSCIGASAFCDSPELTEVKIPSTVTKIKDSAFSRCTGLTKIELPPQLEEVGYSSFYGCSGLTEITIPSSVKTIRSGAFEECYNLESVTLSEGIGEIGNEAFKRTNLKSLNIPKSVKKLGRDIVYNCWHLPYITIEAPSQLEETFEGSNGVFQPSCNTNVYCEPRLERLLRHFDGNEGFITTVDVTLVDGDTITPKKIDYGADITALDKDKPIKPGYTFTGWYTDADCKIRYPDAQLFTNIKGTKLYAGWKFDPDALVCHPLTVTGGTVTVKYDDSDVTNTLTVTPDEATGKKTYSVPDGAEVTVTLDKALIPNGKVFDGWSTTGNLSLLTGQDYKAETITFTMSSGVDIAAQYRDAATVTIEGLENAVIKEGESKDFTVKVDPKDDAKLGEAFIDFGNKNSEIEYQDKNGAYQPMPEGGLPIDLGDVKEQYAFRITPKETGKQTLTAAVKKGENELTRDEKDFVVSEMPILTLKDGVITSVTVPGKNGADPEDITEIVKKNANEDGSFNVPEGATVSVAFDKDAFADSGLKFGHWDITGLDDPNAYQDKESFAFEMPAKAVTLKAMTQDASIEDDEPDIVGPIVIGTTVVVGGAVLGYQAYSLGAEFAGKLMALPYFPSNRSALAMMLWEDAGKPMPESELLYPDVGQEERDMDLQHAARWAMENELIPDLNDEGTAPEEMKFYPDNAVSKIDVLNAWQKAQELKQNA